MSCVMCHVSCVMYYVLCVRCQVSAARCLQLQMDWNFGVLVSSFFTQPPYPLSYRNSTTTKKHDLKSTVNNLSLKAS